MECFARVTGRNEVGPAVHCESGGNVADSACVCQACSFCVPSGVQSSARVTSFHSHRDPRGRNSGYPRFTDEGRRLREVSK